MFCGRACPDTGTREPAKAAIKDTINSVPISNGDIVTRKYVFILSSPLIKRQNSSYHVCVYLRILMMVSPQKKDLNASLKDSGDSTSKR
jgi:hypothetical protein